MKKVITLTVAMLSLAASFAFAQGSISLYVGDCGAGTTTNSVTNACTSNTGSALSVVGSCVLPSDIADFISAGAVMDVQTDAATIPDWWRGDQTGCRTGAMTALMDNTVASSCATIWDSGSTVAVFQVMATDPSRTGNDVPVNRVRFNAVGALTVAAPLTADGTTELGVVKFSVSRAKSVGTGACTGCSAAACLVLNEVNLLHETSGLPPVVITNGSTTNRMVTYNSGLSLVCPDAVPVRNHTWGSVKALYR